MATGKKVAKLHTFSFTQICHARSFFSLKIWILLTQPNIYNKKQKKKLAHLLQPSALLMASWKVTILFLPRLKRIIKWWLLSFGPIPFKCTNGIWMAWSYCPIPFSEPFIPKPSRNTKSPNSVKRMQRFQVKWDSLIFRSWNLFPQRIECQ